MCRFCKIRLDTYDNDREKTRAALEKLSDEDLEGMIADSVYKSIQYEREYDSRRQDIHSAFAGLGIEVYFKRHNLPDDETVSIAYDAGREKMINSTQADYPDELKRTIPPVSFKDKRLSVAIFGAPEQMGKLKDALGGAHEFEQGMFFEKERKLTPEQIGKALDKMLRNKEQSQSLPA